jgi:pimeloyl-ACP methyl ester carboxylesterase
VGPETRYAHAGDIRVAYQVVGDGPRDLVLVPGFLSNLELAWEHPPYERFMRRLCERARVIVFDKRGSGLSDPVGRAATIEDRIDDIRAVMDAAGSEHADVFGWSEGATMAGVFAASFPERVSALVLYGSYARGTPSQAYPWAVPREIWEEGLGGIPELWGQGLSLLSLAPSRIEDEALVRWWGSFERQSMSPAMALGVIRLNMELDICDVLPSIRVPTLVIHRTADVIPVQGARWLAEHIPDAQFVELPGDDHWPWITEPDDSVAEVEEFLTGERHARKPDRVLATVLFTDIVGSTEHAAALGDKRWRDLLQKHDRLIRRELDRHQGREVKTTGDGVLATFAGPARGIDCAQTICEQARTLGIEIRAGLHSGEVELRNGDVGGIAVHIGARVANMAKPGEVLVSGTVKDLVVGSGLEFTDRGTHALKGAPGEWQLYTVGA